MARPSDLERTVLSRKIRDFRISLGKTQDQFASLLGVSGVSVARYETNHIPAVLVLEHLANLALEHKQEKLAGFFRMYARTEPKRYPGSDVMREILEGAAGRATDGQVRVAAAIMLLGSSPEDERRLTAIENILEDKLAVLDLAASTISEAHSSSKGG